MLPNDIPGKDLDYEDFRIPKQHLTAYFWPKYQYRVNCALFTLGNLEQVGRHLRETFVRGRLNLVRTIIGEPSHRDHLPDGLEDGGIEDSHRAQKENEMSIALVVEQRLTFFDVSWLYGISISSRLRFRLCGKYLTSFYPLGRDGRGETFSNDRHISHATRQGMLSGFVVFKVLRCSGDLKCRFAQLVAGDLTAESIGNIHLTNDIGDIDCCIA